jgi:hypothetical protein
MYSIGVKIYKNFYPINATDSKDQSLMRALRMDPGYLGLIELIREIFRRM